MLKKLAQSEVAKVQDLNLRSEHGHSTLNLDAQSSVLAQPLEPQPRPEHWQVSYAHSLRPTPGHTQPAPDSWGSWVADALRS